MVPKQRYHHVYLDLHHPTLFLPKYQDGLLLSPHILLFHNNLEFLLLHLVVWFHFVRLDLKDQPFCINSQFIQSSSSTSPGPTILRSKTTFDGLLIISVIVCSFCSTKLIGVTQPGIAVEGGGGIICCSLKSLS
uniref:CSON011432 protein n=1 Tax=Culicoides sonorensis TaxID=179676 RepID=A0A336LGT5_CULSO